MFPLSNALSSTLRSWRCLLIRKPCAQPLNLMTKRNNSMLVKKLKEIPPNNYVMLVFPCISFYLGVWQIKRRKWKLGVIEELDRKRRMPGVELSDDLSELTADRQYEPFKLIGEFDHSRETCIGPRTLDQASGGSGGLISTGSNIGVHVVTPFKLASSGQEVLVNRGWVSKAQKKSDIIHRPTGEQRLNVVYRTTERGASDGGYDKRLAMWSRRNVKSLAASLGTSEYFFDQSDVAGEVLPPNSPIPGQTIVQIRNEHLSYIFTWFTLGLLMVWIWCNRNLRGVMAGRSVLLKLDKRSRKR